jgi:signal transduction histidine kinase
LDTRDPALAAAAPGGDSPSSARTRGVPRPSLGGHPLGALTVLLVEDGAADAALVKELLAGIEQPSIFVDHVATLAAAAPLVQTRRPDAVLLDLGLPDANGLDTVRRVRALDDAVPIVVLTGHDDEEQGIAAVREGAQDFLVKGRFSADLLARAIQYAIAREQLARQLRDGRARVAHADKLEALGRLAGGVAHGFNNLLTVIQAHASLLLQELPSWAPGHDDVMTIAAAARRGAALTDQLLTFCRGRTSRPTVVDVNLVALDAAEVLKRTVDADIEVDTDLAISPGSAEVDRGELEQVVMNLAANACDAMPAGGRLVIETRSVHLHAELETGGARLRPGAYVAIAVHDTGVGMDDATRARTFEPFFTTKDATLGAGLGLATAYGIVKQAGGDIAVDSEPGRGSSFRVYLPRCARSATAPAGRADAIAPAAARPRKLLLIEDDRAVRRAMRRMLERAGYVVVEAATGRGALASMARELDIGLVVTDVLMPDMNGIEVARRLTTLYPHLPVLFVSGHKDGLTESDGLPPTHGFLGKPFQPDQLLAKIDELIAAAAAGA